MASPSSVAQPKSVLRGHQAQIHASAFIRRNERLATGDAEGYVVLWDLTIMRPRAVWHAHTSAILGIAAWGSDRIITHGRDNKLVVWKLAESEESGMSTALPLDQTIQTRPQPWILHILEVNTMNFCAFALCSASPDQAAAGPPVGDEIFIAVPNTLASESVDIYHLPSQNRLHTVTPGAKTEKNGMVMALSIFHRGRRLTLVTAYENGLAIVMEQDTDGTWKLLYRNQSHNQPILSLDVSPNYEYFLTSGADAIIAKHPLPNPVLPNSGIPNPSHVEANSHADPRSPPRDGTSLLSSASAEERSASTSRPQASRARETQPIKIINTKHAGQQSLRVRSDGKLFATAGWDSKVRVYSTKSMAELAVLKWHQVGCYTVAFADLGGPSTAEHAGKEKSNAGGKDGAEGTVTVAPKLGEMTVKDRRIRQAKEGHWIAAGSKDGRMSLWDIY